MVRMLLLSLAISALMACGGGGGAGPSTPNAPPAGTYKAASGVAQKGPLIKGSTATVQELNSTLSPTGAQYSYQITDNFGDFSPNSTFSTQYIGVLATGYYFDEIANAVSAGPITLNGTTILPSIRS
jgi:hypothetical protein